MSTSRLAQAPGSCRLCGGGLSPRFRLQVLGKHVVQYLTCQECGSLQTEQPYWLAEAYSSNLSNLDTGAAQRNLDNLAACALVCSFLKLRNVIDIGGGDGLLCRLLRDYGINCYVNDRYAHPAYAQGFTTPDFAVPDLVTAFEVVEHFENPAIELDGIFKRGSKAVLVSTGLFHSQASDWWYLAPQSGQHIFLYSSKALDLVGRKYGYRHVKSGDLVLFVAAEVVSKWKTDLLHLMLAEGWRRWLRAAMALRMTPGVWRDHERLRQGS